jgi:DNA (cytosine-5)-methyltransferase 1
MKLFIKMSEEKFAVIELFAGVGGFRLGLEGDRRKGGNYSSITGYKKRIDNQGFFKTGYANQYEPARKKQFAATVYADYYRDDIIDNTDIAEVNSQKIINSIEKSVGLKKKIILVGGFPCQDYSVANGLHTSKGLGGKKGVLWWEIYRHLTELKDLNRQPEILLLENVDRLLVSPANQRGRDFAIMLYTLSELGYNIEYKVINAAEYGFPQKRKRVFILAYLRESPLDCCDKVHSNIQKEFSSLESEKLESIDLSFYRGDDLVSSLKNIEDVFRFKISPFGNSGVCRNFEVYPCKEKGEIPENCKTLGDILKGGRTKIPDSYYVKNSDLVKWKEYKSAKRILRFKPNGEEYFFSEGKMSLFDSRRKPSRTLITSEGGSSASRTKHLIETSKGPRRLLPVELERLNMFPDNITKHSDVQDTERAFMMGNALVVGVVEKFRNMILRVYS